MYVISSSEFDTKKEAVAQMEKWLKMDKLCPKAKVYKVEKTYKPILEIKLKEVKNGE